MDGVAQCWTHGHDWHLEHNGTTESPEWHIRSVLVAILVGVSEIVDPTPIADERIAVELAPLREALRSATDPKDRKRIERSIQRQEAQIRREVLGARAHW